MALSLSLWNLSQTPQLPKPESAREQNDGVLVQGHLGFQGGGTAGKGEPGGVTCPSLCHLQGLASGAASSTSCHLPSFLPFSVFLPSGFMRLWEGLELRFIFKCRLMLPQCVMYPSLHHHYLHKPRSSWRLKQNTRQDGVEREEARDKEAVTLPWVLGT